MSNAAQYPSYPADVNAKMAAIQQGYGDERQQAAAPRSGLGEIMSQLSEIEAQFSQSNSRLSEAIERAGGSAPEKDPQVQNAPQAPGMFGVIGATIMRIRALATEHHKALNRLEQMM